MIGKGDLGALEREVMDALWSGGEKSVSDLRAILGRGRAYTTLMTTADRLFKKGLLRRRREGRAFLYSARVSREEAVLRPAAAVLGGLLEDHPGVALSFLVETVSTRDRALLDDLERLIREKREERKR